MRRNRREALRPQRAVLALRLAVHKLALHTLAVSVLHLAVLPLTVALVLRPVLPLTVALVLRLGLPLRVASVLRLAVHKLAVHRKLPPIRTVLLLVHRWRLLLASLINRSTRWAEQWWPTPLRSIPTANPRKAVSAVHKRAVLLPAPTVVLPLKRVATVVLPLKRVATVVLPLKRVAMAVLPLKRVAMAVLLLKVVRKRVAATVRLKALLPVAVMALPIPALVVATVLLKEAATAALPLKRVVNKATALHREATVLRKLVLRWVPTVAACREAAHPWSIPVVAARLARRATPLRC